MVPPAAGVVGRRGGGGVVASNTPVLSASRTRHVVPTSPAWRGPSPSRFYSGLSGRVEFPGVPLPRPRGVIVRHHQVIARVPAYGFGFCSPVTPYPYAYPVYTGAAVVAPPPIIEQPIIGPPAIYDPGYAGPAYPYPDYAGAGPGYEDPGYAAGGYGPAEAGYDQAPPAPVEEAARPLPPDGERGYQPAPDAAVVQPQEQDDQANMPDDHMARLMQEGTQAFTAGDYDEAGRMFLQVGMADPDNVDAWLAYAVARFATRDYEASAIAIRRGVRRFPDVVDSPLDLRERYGQPADFDRHLAALDEYLRGHADDGEAWLVVGFVRHFSSQRELAARTFETIARRFPSDRDVAEMFLKARPLSEIMNPEGVPAPEGAPESIEGAPAEDMGAAPQGGEGMGMIPQPSTPADGMQSAPRPGMGTSPQSRMSRQPGMARPPGTSSGSDLAPPTSSDPVETALDAERALREAGLMGSGE